jgi:glutaredoxin
MEQKSITVYSLSTCSSCRALTKLLEEMDLRFKAVDVDLLETDEKAEAMKTIKQLTSLVAFPISVIGDKVIVGFKEKEILSALDENTTPMKHLFQKVGSKLFGM